MLDPWAVRNSCWKKNIASFLYERSMLQGAACIRALCQSEAQSIRAFGCTRPICVIPNGMDLPVGPFANPPWQGRVKPGARVLLYLGRLHPKKGLSNLLHAWSQISTACGTRCDGELGAQARDWVLIIAGWDERGHEQELKCLAAKLGLRWADSNEPAATLQRSQSAAPESPAANSAGVLFLGPQFGEAKAACYHHSDAFILPSFSEGLPMVILEAWSHAKPVLMTPHCNLPEGFATGAAIRIGTKPAEILPGLLRLFDTTPDQREEIGGRGRRLVVKKFNWDRISHEMLAVCSWVMRAEPAPESLML
jgi:poly(glycerol-phosphate) alpha-glucosyltransferase